MNIRALQAIKRHRFALPWLVFKRAVAIFMKIETLVVFRYDLRAVEAAVRSSLPGFQIALIDGPASPAFVKLCDRYPEKDFASRLGNARRQCYVALRGNEVAGYAWVSAESLYVDEIARAYPLAADEVFIYDCFVDEEYRGQGIYPAMLREALQQCAKVSGNARRAVIGAVSTNHASIRGIRKAGFSEWKRIHYAEWGRRQRWWGLDACAGTV